MNLNQVTLPASDVAKSVAFYRSLGFGLIVESAHYARFKSSQGDSTFSLHLVEGAVVPSQTVVYFECALLDERVAELKAQGVVFTQAPKDEPWLWREARLRDPAGNELCLYRAADNRLNPPWRVGGQQPGALTIPVLETPRLTVRALCEADLPALLEINRDPEVVRYLPYGAWQGMDDARAWHQRMATLMLQGKMFYSVIVEKHSRRVIGTCLLLNYDASAARAEIGYLQGRQTWGNGYMHEAVGAVIGEAFAALSLRRIEAHIDPRNTASARLLQRLGFALEGVLRENWNDHGEVSDTAIYGLLRRDWPTAQ